MTKYLRAFHFSRAVQYIWEEESPHAASVISLDAYYCSKAELIKARIYFLNHIPSNLGYVSKYVIDKSLLPEWSSMEDFRKIL